MTPHRPAALLATSVLVAAVLTPVAAQAAAGPALTVDVTSSRHAISPDIYGVNFSDTATAAATGITVDRFGGNSASRYNYLTDETNTGSDYYYENVTSTPAATFIGKDRSAGLRTVWELPMTGYVSKASPTTHPFLCSFPTETFPTQDSTDYWDPHCGNGVHNGTNLTGADPLTTSVTEGPSWDQAEVAHLVSLYGKASSGGVPFYELDNEPSLWNSTHRDVHPSALTYSELSTKSTAAGAAVKAADPSASVLGPSDWGWCAYFYSAADGCNTGADRQAHGNVDFAAYYLAQMKAYDTAHGTRVLDYFDEHYYPQDGVSLTTAGSAAQQAQRLLETRTLWDSSYKDDSWIGLPNQVNTAVGLIPRMHGWVDANYPGTKLAISEYNFGGLESLNGALAEADVLGIFGREKVDLATLWGGPTAAQPGAYAFRLYRNYDGTGGKFGDTYVGSTSSDQTKLAVYGAQRTADGALTLMVINKSTGDLTSSLDLAHFATGSTAQVWRYSSANLTKIVRQADVAASSSMGLTFPASSATLLVIPAATPSTGTGSGSGPGTVTGPPPVPPGTVVRPPSPTVSGTTVTFGGPLPALPPGAVTLTLAGGRAVRITLACKNATTVVNCASGPVTAVIIKPVAPLVPGGTYRLQISGLPAVSVDATFRAATVVPVTSPALVYHWATVPDGHAYGRSVLAASTAGATASYRFTGSNVSWWSTNGPGQSIADVYVDGHKRATVNEYSLETSPRVAHKLSHLGTGSHLLTIKVRGVKGNNRGTGTRVTIDAIRVGADKVLTTPSVTTRWSSAVAGQSASLTFVGTGVSWSTHGTSKATHIAVYLDGHRVPSHRISGLTSGRHTLRIVVLAGHLTLKGFQVN